MQDGDDAIDTGDQQRRRDGSPDGCRWARRERARTYDEKSAEATRRSVWLPTYDEHILGDARRQLFELLIRE